MDQIQLKIDETGEVTLVEDSKIHEQFDTPFKQQISKTDLSTVKKLPQEDDQVSLQQQVNETFPDQKEKDQNLRSQNLIESLRESNRGNMIQYEHYLATTKERFTNFENSVKEFHPLFPRKDLCVEAIVQSIYDEQSLVKKRALDFLINYMNFDGETETPFINEDYVILIYQQLLSLLTIDLSAKRRVYKYIFGPETEDEVEQLPQKNRELLIKAMRLVLRLNSIESRLNSMKILQMVFNQQQSIIEMTLQELNVEIFENLMHIEDLPNNEKEEEGQKEENPRLLKKQTIERFFLSVQSHLGAFFKKYVQNDASIMKSKVIGLFIKYQNNNLDEEQTNLIIFGLVKIINEKLSKMEMDEEAQNTMTTITAFLDKLDPFSFKLENGELKTMLNDFLVHFQKFKTHYQSDSLNLDASTLKKGLIFCIWILLLFKEKKLIEEWVIKIETLLSHVSKQPKVLLAAIKGIQRLFELNREDQSDMIIFKNITESIFDLTIKKSWELLDNVEFHSSAINLIFQLTSQNKAKVFQILEMNLFSKDQNTSIKFLQRLVTFWKLAQTFELNQENQSLERFVIFKLLEFLENQHPIKRQIAKSWLIDSNEHFQNILDYMILTLLQNSHFYFTKDGQIYHYEKYDTQEIMKVYTRMKYLITNNQSQFVKFMNKVSISDRLLIEMFQIMNNDEINQYHYYYQILLEVLKRFMQAQCLQVFSNKFKEENILVQTSSCETLEILINCLAVTNTALFDKKLLKSIMKSYFMNVDNEVQVMQIHLLNLLKLLIFNLKTSPDFNIQKVLEEYQLLKKVLDSLLVANNVYTLVKILDFIQKIMTEISNHSSEQDLLKLIDPIFNFYYNFYCQYYNNEAQINSAKIIFTSLMNLIKQYCSLDAFIVDENEQEAKGFFRSVFSWKKKVVAQIDYPVIEKFMVERLDKICQIIIYGWETQNNVNREPFAFNIGLKGVSQKEKTIKFSKKTILSNEDFLEIVQKIFYKYKTQFFNLICEIWSKEFQNTKTKELMTSSVLEKILDLLLYLNLKLETFYQMIQNSQFYKSIMDEQKKLTVNIISHSLSQRESAILSMVYAYLRFREYAFIEDKIERRDYLRRFWTTLMGFLKNFQKNPHPFIKIWLLNIFYMSAKKYPLQEIINEYSIFRNLHDMENGYIEDVIKFVCESNQTQYEKPIGATHYGFFFPLPAKIVTMICKSPELYLDKIFIEFPDQKYLEYFYKILALYALREISVNLLFQTYESKKTYHISKRLNTFINICLDELTKVKVKSQMIDKVNEEIIKLIHLFIDTQREELFKLCKNRIQLYFDSDHFFQVSQDAINSQKDIIKWYTEFTSRENLQIYLKNMNFSSLFKSKSAEQKVRFQSFYRLCFILYSGDKGTLLTRQVVKFLFSQIRDVIKNYQSDSILLIMMFFCIRIIIIRTDTKMFVEMFPLFFPVLYELMNIIFLDDTKLQDLNLKLATLKLLEMLLLFNYEGIWNYYWNFGIDSPVFDKEILDSPNLPSFTSQFPFIPFFQTCIKNNYSINYFKLEGSSNERYFEEKCSKKGIVIKQNSINNEIELSELVVKLMESFSDFCRIGQEVDFDEINQLILSDFVSLHEIA